MRLTKVIKTKLAVTMTAKAVKNKMLVLEKEVIAINDHFWKQYKVELDELVGIDPKEYPRLIQIGVMNYTNTVYAVIQGERVTYDYKLTDLREAIEKMLDLKTRWIISGHARALGMAYQTSTPLPCPSREKLGVVKDTGEVMQKRVTKVLKDYVEILEAAYDFYINVTQLLHKTSTLKALEAVMPEAAALVEVPAKPVNNIVPASLVETVRAQMLKGIPL